MGETYEINEYQEVIPYTDGRKCLDTRAWRDATELELQQAERIEELETAISDAVNAFDCVTWGNDGDCGSKAIIEKLEDSL